MQGSGQVGGLLPGDCCQPEASVRFTMTSCSADGSPWGFAQHRNPGVPAAAPPEGGTPHSSTGSWDGRWASPPAENWVTKNCHPPPHPTHPPQTAPQPRALLTPTALTFAQVHHAVLAALRGLVLHGEADLLPDQLLPQELPGREPPGLEGKEGDQRASAPPRGARGWHMVLSPW